MKRRPISNPVGSGFSRTPGPPKGGPHACSRTLRIVCVVALGFWGSLHAGAQSRPVKALVGGVLVDGNGSRPLQNSVIIVDGDRVRAVGQVGSLAVPPGAEVISTEGMTVLPGLWDMHVHLQIVGHADYDHWDKTYPPAFESVIFPAVSQAVAARRRHERAGSWRTARRQHLDRVIASTPGAIPGPTMYVSGPFIQHAPYPGTESYRWGVNGADDARAKVRRLVEAKVDVIKLIDQDQMTMEEVRAVVDEAHKGGKPVVGHAHRPEEIRRALLAGVDCLEHTGLATAPEYPPDIIEMIRERTAKMSLGPLWWTPTVEGLLNYEYFRDNHEALDDPAWQDGLPKDIVDDVKKSIEHPDRLPYYQLTPARRPTLAHKFNQLREAGVDAADRHRQRHPDEFPYPFDVARTGCVGHRLQGRPDDGHPRRHLLAGGGDESRIAGWHRHARKVRRHHRGARRRTPLHVAPAARRHRHQARRAVQVELSAVPAKPGGRPHLISIVVPVFNESAVVRAFHERSSRVLRAIADFDYELLFVDDGSRDDTYAQLKALAANDAHVRLLKFSRNFGHQIAISAGIDHARGDCVVVTDVDLQDPPEVIPMLIDKWREGFDVVYGRRAGRDGETMMKRVTAAGVLPAARQDVENPDPA